MSLIWDYLRNTNTITNTTTDLGKMMGHQENYSPCNHADLLSIYTSSGDEISPRFSSTEDHNVGTTNDNDVENQIVGGGGFAPSTLPPTMVRSSITPSRGVVSSNDHDSGDSNSVDCADAGGDSNGSDGSDSDDVHQVVDVVWVTEGPFVAPGIPQKRARYSYRSDSCQIELGGNHQNVDQHLGNMNACKRNASEDIFPSDRSGSSDSCAPLVKRFRSHSLGHSVVADSLSGTLNHMDSVVRLRNGGWRARSFPLSHNDERPKIKDIPTIGKKIVEIYSRLKKEIVETLEYVFQEFVRMFACCRKPSA